ncbi:hypothetical protein [Streptobacillus moniliformis]|uniref:hypothetical protein n=1 Tax=Streptobacillus moniliformis TaxID=34105 RepID=UPI0009BC8F86|nr:hypothetical protein [Streptobacillus moniliformis]
MMRTKIEDFLKSKEKYKVYKDFSEIPEYIKEMIYDDNMDIGFSRDLITPLSENYGLERLFKYIKEYQPRTYEVLKDAKNLMYIVFEEHFLKYGYPISRDCLAFELNGTALILDRKYYGDNPDQPSFKKDTYKTLVALSKELYYSYYYEFIGLGFPVLNKNWSFRNLPQSIYEWNNLDVYLEEIGLKKKRRIEVIKSYTKYFSKLLNNKKANAEDMYTFMDTNIYGEVRNDNDYAFFVFAYIENGDIYVIRNGDYERPKKLINPVEAIDKYVAHVLSGKDNFNFDEYLEEMKVDIEETKVYEVVELKTKGIIKDREKVVNEVMSLMNCIEISDEIYYKTESGEYEDVSHFNFEEEEIEIMGFMKDEDDNIDFKIYYSYKKGKHLLAYSKLYETSMEKGMIVDFLKVVSNNNEIKEKVINKDSTKFYIDLWDIFS